MAKEPIRIIPQEEMKIKEEKEKKEVVYDKEYRDALAKRLGFKSSEEYEKYKYEKKKEKLEKIEKIVAKAKIEDETAKIKRERAEIKVEMVKIARGGMPTNVTIYDLPVYMQETSIIKSPSFIDNLIIGLRKEHNNLQKKLNNCDLNTLKDICELGKLIDLHTKELQGIPSFELLLKDYNNALYEKDYRRH